MHIRVTPGQIRPDKIEEGRAIFGELFAAYRQGGGFRQGYLAADEGSGEGLVVTLWDDEAAARAATEEASPILARLGPLMASGQVPAPPRAFEVLLEG
jgi:heme-degrading monooxygenase HmoA